MPTSLSLLVLCAVVHAESAPLARDPMLSPRDAYLLEHPEEIPPPPPLPWCEELRLDLQGIIQVYERGIEALIDGELYRVGDTVKGARITAIDEKSVRLRFRGRDVIKILGREAPCRRHSRCGTCGRRLSL